jgi:hypothetical protein
MGVMGRMGGYGTVCCRDCPDRCPITRPLAGCHPAIQQNAILRYKENASSFGD